MTASATPPTDRVTMNVTPPSKNGRDGDFINKDSNSSQTKRTSFHVPASVLEFFLEDCDDAMNTSSTSSDDSLSSSSSSSPQSSPKIESREPQSTTRSAAPSTPQPQSFSKQPHRQSSTHPLIQNCFHWLSSRDIDMNRLGLQRLMLLTKGRAIDGHQTRSEARLVSSVLVYGTPSNSNKFLSTEHRLRYAFATLLCNAPHDDVGIRQRQSSIVGASIRPSTILDFDLEAMMSSDASNDRQIMDDDDCSTCHSDSSYSTSSDWNDDDHDDYVHYATAAGPQGKMNGALHGQSLKVLANALAYVVRKQLSDQESESDDDIELDESIVAKYLTAPKQRPIPLHDTIWRNIIHSLVHNIETNHTADITGYSLLVLRLLQKIHPEVVNPLLQQSLFPQLVHLQEYGKERLLPIIRVEASKLLEGAKHCCNA